jgi:hypothetical protein
MIFTRQISNAKEFAAVLLILVPKSQRWKKIPSVSSIPLTEMIVD